MKGKMRLVALLLVLGLGLSACAGLPAGTASSGAAAPTPAAAEETAEAAHLCAGHPSGRRRAHRSSGATTCICA